MPTYLHVIHVTKHKEWSSIIIPCKKRLLEEDPTWPKVRSYENINHSIYNNHVSTAAWLIYFPLKDRLYVRWGHKYYSQDDTKLGQV